MDALQRLRNSRFLRTEAEVAEFDAALGEVSGEEGLRSIRELHLLLEDDCGNHEVMFGLVHLLESYEAEVQVRALLEVLPQLLMQAPQWTRVLHYRVLNDAVARDCYRGLMPEFGGQARGSARSVFEAIVQEEDEPLRGLAASML